MNGYLVFQWQNTKPTQSMRANVSSTKTYFPFCSEFEMRPNKQSFRLLLSIERTDANRNQTLAFTLVQEALERGMLLPKWINHRKLEFLLKSLIGIQKLLQ